MGELEDNERIKIDNFEMTARDRRLCNYFVMTNRWAFKARYMPIATKKYYKVRFYQAPLCLFENIVVYGGRSWGKSYTLEGDILQTIINVYNEESVLTAFRRMHIQDREKRVITYLNEVPYFKAFVAKKGGGQKGSITQTPIYTISLKNGHDHYGISVGDDPAAVMIQGKHPTFRFMEEAQFYTMGAWEKWQSTQDPKGSVDRYYGTVNGRLDTPYRKMDGDIEKFRKGRFHIPQLMEMYFNQEKKREKRDAFGSEEANEYLQQVLAEWGEPLLGVWDEAAIKSCMDIERSDHGRGDFVNQMQVIEITGKQYKELKKKILEGDESLSVEQVARIAIGQCLHNLRVLPDGVVDVMFGIDAGYTSPTVVLPFYYKDGKWNLSTRIMLKDKMIHEHQTEFIDYLADFYNASTIAVDFTSSEGKAIVTILSNVDNAKYSEKNYEDRLSCVIFSATMVMGYKPDGEEIIEKVKNGTTTVLHRMFSQQLFRFFYDEAIISEFNSESKKQISAGVSIVTPQNVHIPEAFRCFAYGYQTVKCPPAKPKDEGGDVEFTYPFYQDVVSMFGR